MLDPSDSGVTYVPSLFPSSQETSFESGYNTSPTSYNQVLSPKTQNSRNIMDPNMDGSRLFLTSPLKSPFKATGAAGPFTRSPIKMEVFSPFKDSSLSPFKLIYQSPSKGSFDDWDKDFLAGFEENLFGMNDSTEFLDEWLKSPSGKAMMENRNSPLRVGAHHSVVKRLKISPENKNRKQTFQPLHDSNAEMISAPVYVKEEYDDFFIKEENTSHDHMYGQSGSYDSMNPLSAIDPNKIGATPIKPRFTNIENAPIRKLSMRMPGNVNPVPNVVVQRSNIVQVENVWPSKEKLKFARMRFKEILNKAVQKEIEIIKELKDKKAAAQKRKEIREQNNIQRSSNVVVHTGGKVSKSVGGKKSGRHVSASGKSKGKSVKPKTRKDKYPQIKMALAKPQQKMLPNVVHKELFPIPGFTDPGWYPSDEGDSDDGTWNGPPPIFRQSSTGFNDNDDSSDEDWHPISRQYETLSGRKVKKRKMY